LVGIDLDSCRDANGAIADWAQGVITRFNTYAEVSPSETGVKLFFLMTADDWNKLLSLLGLNAEDKQLTRKTFAAGPHREVAIDTARFYAITEQKFDDRGFRLVPFADVKWFVEVAGPNYLKQQKSSNGHSDNPYKEYGEESARKSHPEQWTTKVRHRRGHGYARQPRAQLSAAMERRAEPRPAGHPAQP
jgi:hypothetical protein